MITHGSDSYFARRSAHERARQLSHPRVSSVLAAHGALYTSIRNGLFTAEDRLDEMNLSSVFSVSRNAVRGALRMLADEGVVSRAPRVGTVVSSRFHEVPLDTSMWWGDRPQGKRRVVVLDERWVPSTPVTRHYLQTQSARVHVDEKFAAYGGHPALLSTRFSLEEGANRVPATGLNEPAFAALFERTYGSALAAVDCWIEAKGADERSAALFGLPVGTPLLARSRVLTGEDGIRREYSIAHYRASLVALSGALEQESSPEALAGPRRRPVVRALHPQRSAQIHRRRSSAGLHTELRAAIREGLFRVGERLNEDELADLFGASRTTVRMVLAQLTEEGIVHRSRKQGTIVIAPITDYTVTACTPLRHTGSPRYSSELLGSTRIATPPFIRRLLDTTSPHICLDEYLIHQDGRPATVFIRYTEPRARPLPTTPFEDCTTAFELAFGASLGRQAVDLHAVKAVGRVAERLQVRDGTALLLVERLLCDANGRPREFTHTYHAAAQVAISSHHHFRPLARFAA